MNISRACLLIAYYFFARKLPSTSMPCGHYCDRLRGVIAKQLFKSFGHGVRIKHGAYFGNGINVEIGDGSQIGENARIASDTFIGKNVMMGLDVLVLSTVHSSNLTDTPLIDQGYEPNRPVTINDGAWIGGRAILLPGVTIGEGAIVGAGAVVTRDVPPMTVVGGVPAKVLKKRN